MAANYRLLISDSILGAGQLHENFNVVFCTKLFSNVGEFFCTTFVAKFMFNSEAQKKSKIENR